jgi:hypothetical protein
VHGVGVEVCVRDMPQVRVYVQRFRRGDALENRGNSLEQLRRPVDDVGRPARSVRHRHMQGEGLDVGDGLEGVIRVLGPDNPGPTLASLNLLCRQPHFLEKVI